jgi:hypothetical protein
MIDRLTPDLKGRLAFQELGRSSSIAGRPTDRRDSSRTCLYKRRAREACGIVAPLQWSSNPPMDWTCVDMPLRGNTAPDSLNGAGTRQIVALALRSDLE